MGGRGSSSGKSREKNLGLITISGNVIDGTKPDSLERLTAMAQRGELPSEITGTREERARIYEEIDRLYPKPAGVMSEYHVVEEMKSSAHIIFDNEYTSGIDTNINYPRKMRATEAEKQGAIKYAVYKSRANLEYSATHRREWQGGGGFATMDMARKYGGRGLSDKEKRHVERETAQHIQKLFKSSWSPEGRAKDNEHWYKTSEGWRRKG